MWRANVVIGVVVLLLLFPIKNVVILDSAEITSIRPFGGRVNNELVGSTLTCMYWLEPEKVQGVRTYETWTTPFLSMMGDVFYVNNI
ncbi:MAG: hypothetical protein DRR06_19170 [Gammaproteobacteria bacterium]|nr:MAG: hypothetical protein DRR06_19170 [Gammaproteobacteria bacterium]